ncbi:MAG: LysR family transcriptional regulator [Calditrichaeota bacterium]|nr:LysR family transcriptional regulator [Calditrichota bacterium]
MELKYFRLIKTIEEEGNIVNSSERLFLTQSALSHQLKDMEEQLGFKVFHRGRNKWTLTNEGRELYKLSVELFKRIDDGFAQIRQIKDGAKGRIKLSAECQSFFHELPEFVQKMAVLYPEIEIDLSLGASQQSISQLLSGEIDMTIVTSKPESDQLVSREILSDEIFALMHNEHYLNQFDYLDASHFSDVHLLINSFPLEEVSVYEHFLKPNKIIPIRISAIPFTEISLQMIRANMGIMCAPKWAVKSFKLPEDLSFKRIGKHGLKRTHYLVYRAESSKKEHIINFVANFEEDFKSAH